MTLLITSMLAFTGVRISDVLTVAGCVFLLFLSVPLVLVPLYRKTGYFFRRQAVAVTHKGNYPVEVNVFPSRPTGWAHSLSAGFGFILTAMGMTGLWLLARAITRPHSYEIDFLIVPVVLLVCGLVYIARALGQTPRT